MDKRVFNPEANNAGAESFASSAFQQHRAALHRFLLRRLRNEQNAQDVAQEVYLRLLRVEDGELIRNPLAFLYRIALNLVYELRLRHQRDPVLFDSEVTEELEEQLTEASEHRDPLAQLSTESELRRVLSTLSPTIRAVFVLRKRDGMTDREIAAELNLSVHTVKKYLCQAVMQCRASIEGMRP